MKLHLLAVVLLIALGPSSLHAQDPSVATEYRRPTPGNGPNDARQVTFVSHRLGTDYAEGITTLDMNGDGFADLVSGAYWYENPGPRGGEWKQHQFRTVEIHGEFVSDCGEWTIDVNHDGAADLVTAGWITNGLWWYENPNDPKSTAPWKKHFITDSYDTEGGVMGDINGDDKPDLALAHYVHSGVIWVDFSGPEPRVHHVGDKEQDGHGIGIADVDGDGKPDILTPNGWFKNIDAEHDKWEWHPEWRLGDTGFPILGYDVNGDGRLDIIYGQGHSYGLYWLEQTGTPAHLQWKRHIIDESFSQSHALKLVDLDGDGEPEVVTGKRYRGHSGNDPGSYDPLVVYYYKIDRKTAQFTRHAISVGGTGGVGTQIVAEDLDKDGDMDLATAVKTGVHVFENLSVDKVPKEQREKEIVLNPRWPFAGEGSVVEQQDAPPK